MKILYVIKSLLPLIFLPIAPGMLQYELARQGLLTGDLAACVIAAQGLFTLGIIAWIAFTLLRQRQKAFLRMSCVSKKVFFEGQWMTVEQYLAENHNVHVSHGLTPDEMQAWVADAEDYLRRENHGEEDEAEVLPEIEHPADLPDLHHTAA